MHRQPLLDLLERYVPTDESDAQCRDRFVEFVRGNPECFERSLEVGHVTGAAWLLSADGDKALLTHHRKLDCWLQLGGHADGDADVVRVALREAREESGIQNIELLDAEVFDLDIHTIPQHKDTPPHEHYDVRFLCQSKADHQLAVSDESHDLGWFTIDQLEQIDVDESIHRMCRNWRQLSAAPLRVDMHNASLVTNISLPVLLVRTVFLRSRADWLH